MNTTEQTTTPTPETPATPSATLHLEIEALIYRYGLPEVMNAANEVVQGIFLEADDARRVGRVH